MLEKHKGNLDKQNGIITNYISKLEGVKKSGNKNKSDMRAIDSQISRIRTQLNGGNHKYKKTLKKIKKHKKSKKSGGAVTQTITKNSEELILKLKKTDFLYEYIENVEKYIITLSTHISGIENVSDEVISSSLFYNDFTQKEIDYYNLIEDIRTRWFLKLLEFNKAYNNKNNNEKKKYN